MKIEGLIWLRDIVDELAWKHQVELEEVEEALNSQPKIRFVEKGERKSEDVYMALGQTDAGRYLAVLFIYKWLVKVWSFFRALTSRTCSDTLCPSSGE